MKLAGLHPDEQRRLQSLRSSGLLNSGKEERFDRLTRLARSLYNLPVASISLVGEDLLHIKSCAGLDVDTVPRDISFCAHTILQTDPLIVNDMQQDERFHDNPLVIERRLSAFTPGIRCNCRMARPVGSFCLMDHPAAIVFRP
ncbi:diguanylate cyclase [Klebsiella pneumoniae]|uniref:Diguanylate cyclase n=1 Tax=Klebsiella pneumoniae TaxID=573 RepID=A0A2X3F297_KLEPN|nr:diguanylate cyclase [Klebsiella pneumoniae]